MTDCPNATMRDHLPDLLHGTLDATTRAGVETHLAHCGDCADELALLRRSRAALQHTPAVDVSRIVAALPRPMSGGPRLVQFPAVAQPARSRWAWSGHRAALAAAAVLVVAVGIGTLGSRGSVPAGSPVVVGDVAARGGLPTAPAVERVGATQRPIESASGAPGAASAPSAASAPLLVVNTAALSDADLAGLLDDLDDLEAVPAADPLSLVPVGGLRMPVVGSGDGS